MNIWKSMSVISIIIIIVGGGYLIVQELRDIKKDQESVEQTIREQLASSTPEIEENIVKITSLPNATTTTPTTWKNSMFSAYGFSISHPADIIDQIKDDTVIFAFPKNSYFRWPLQDDARITIKTIDDCNVEPSADVSPNATSSFSLNKNDYDAYEYSDMAAGNIFRERIYASDIDGTCYQFSLYSHGANGAGLYVSGQALINKYDAQHAQDLQKIYTIFNSMVNSFRIVQD